MKKIFVIFIMILFVKSALYSQSIYVDNALKFSSYDYSGTARFVGMGGAFGALGGDFSAISINPAGLGVFRSSELVFSPGMSYNTNSSSYINNTSEDNGYAVNLNNFGFVVSNDLENSDSRWVNFNFGVGFNRIKDFNKDVQFRGVNDNSLMGQFVDNANIEGLSDMYEFLIWDAYIIDYDTVAGEYYSEITDEFDANPANFEINQQKIIQTEGGVNEFSFSFGGNYAHKLYIGASIGIARLRYSEYASHYESETNNLPLPFIKAYDFKEYSKINGTGFTFKVGAIYKPIDFLRLGVSVHLPTFYDLDQEFYNSATGYFDSNPTTYSESYTQDYQFLLNSPLRAIGSIGFQIGKMGLIDIDYEYVDYSTMKMEDEYNSQEVNDDNVNISRVFQETHNIRAGIELRTGSLYYRVGGRYSTSPYANISSALNSDFEKITLAGGLGYREKNFFVDFAFAQTLYNYKMIAYEYEFNDAVASIDSKLNNFILTFGIKF